MNGLANWPEWLLAWYEAQKRDLPWRKGKDPYKIWISEVMLQQTRVETVIPYFERFLDQFPTLQDLAEAAEAAVLKAWEGLGYYSRARHLHAAVREVAAKYEGRIPDTYEHFRALPGVGDYTAGAVLSIGYDVPVPAVDGNVLRVLARFYGIKENILSSRTQKQVRERLARVLPADRPADFNQALMELGALVCKVQSPLCTSCPLQAICVANRMQLQKELPIRQKTASSRVEHLSVLLLTAGASWLVRQRPAKGLLAGMWELPNTCLKGIPTKEQHFDEACRLAVQLGVPIQDGLEEVGDYTHVFSHLVWEMTLFRSSTTASDVPVPLRWADRTGSKELPFGQVFLKMIKDHL